MVSVGYYGSERIQKVLLMGTNGVGKTSMRSIIFANFHAKDTFKLTPTIDVKSSKAKFLGNLVLNLWDCAGQDLFMKQYFEAQREHIFKNVEVLIFVFDVISRKFQLDLEEYQKCQKAIDEFSKSAHVFCLIHKMDLIPKDFQEQVYEEKKAEIYEHSMDKKPLCFGTSIWDETLYKAWSQIVHTLIPNVSKLEANLREFCTQSSAAEVVLFEKSTFLEICHVDLKGNEDAHRFEKISNIIKQFKLSVMSTNYQFQAMIVKNGNFKTFIDEFTQSTYIMVILTDKEIEEQSLQLNIEASRHHFEDMISKSLH